MILVTGASGFLGSELVKQLIANGESVRIIVRPSSDISDLASIKDKIEIMEGDILDVPSLEIAMDGIEKIYHSAAVIGYDDSFYDSMYKCNIEGTANVVNVALTKGIKKLLHVSSIAAIGGKPNDLISEDTKWEKNEWTTHYGITKMLAEREVWRAEQEGLEVVVVNPGIILGSSSNENKATMRVFKRIASGKMPFYSNGTNGFIDVRDVARICIQLMNSPVHSERFILINQNLSFKDYFERIAKRLNVQPPKRALNKTLGNVFLFADWMASTLSRRKRSFTKEIFKVSMEHFEYSNEKIKRQLDYTFIPFDETIDNIAQQLK
ncbi:MAG TPA: NAD-dependent epimerase/dehydratase family protein [Chitinophagales bacterium]|nr:NAD-dependent epimerase/dehydratase family protein [Chitinophagales bacterium]